jgi:NAD-dependent protein deacetylase/lipoamidase
VLAMIPPGLITHLQAAHSMAVLTGAGASAESGVPTFRDAQTGLWTRYRPEDLATPEAFRRNPKLVWDWYSWRKKLVMDVQPNPGHYALAEIESHLDVFTLITQNVDGLHQRAGSHKVLELHGNIQRLKCFQEGVVVAEDEAVQGLTPRCPYCGGLLRPDVVWFGEPLPAEALEQAKQAARVCDTFLSVGTSTLVQPAASLPWLALQHGAVVIEINPQATPLSDAATYTLRGPSGVVLPELIQAVWG